MASNIDIVDICRALRADIAELMRHFEEDFEKTLNKVYKIDSIFTPYLSTEFLRKYAGHLTIAEFGQCKLPLVEKLAMLDDDKSPRWMQQNKWALYEVVPFTVRDIQSINLGDDRIMTRLKKNTSLPRDTYLYLTKYVDEYTAPARLRVIEGDYCDYIPFHDDSKSRALPSLSAYMKKDAPVSYDTLNTFIHSSISTYDEIRKFIIQRAETDIELARNSGRPYEDIMPAALFMIKMFLYNDHISDKVAVDIIIAHDISELTPATPIIERLGYVAYRRLEAYAKAKGHNILLSQMEIGPGPILAPGDWLAKTKWINDTRQRSSIRTMISAGLSVREILSAHKSRTEKFYACCLSEYLYAYRQYQSVFVRNICRAWKAVLYRPGAWKTNEKGVEEYVPGGYHYERGLREIAEINLSMGL